MPLISGKRVIGEHVHIGYFDQQQLEALDLQASPALHIQRLSPQVREQDILNFLGGFNFRGDAATAPIGPLSGGEKARLALAMVVWQRPNLLVLDEPTNHLDLEMRHAMELALQRYEGALVLVSHDRHMLRNSVEELLLVHDGSVEEYGEDLSGYERWLLKGFSADKATTQDSQSSALSSKKQQRQEAAAAREKLRPLRKSLQQAENAMSNVEAALEKIQAALQDTTLYNSERKEELAELLQREGALKTNAAALEDQWLDLQQQLEELGALD